jgi:hypothetical protein
MRQSAGAANERKLLTTISGARNSNPTIYAHRSFDGLDRDVSKSEARPAFNFVQRASARNISGEERATRDERQQPSVHRVQFAFPFVAFGSGKNC